MYELHSEDPALELTLGRYALIMKTQVYDFSVEGLTVDSRQCIERTVASNGTFYSDCKSPDASSSLDGRDWKLRTFLVVRAEIIK
jgi:hypothetical protein